MHARPKGLSEDGVLVTGLAQIRPPLPQYLAEVEGPICAIDEIL